MLSAFIRLLTLAALALMPFGMGAASAGPAHHQASAASAGHCDEPGGQPAEEAGDRLAGCTAGCSMFMAQLAPADEPDALPGQMTARSPAKQWTNLPPETATPPPKHS